MSKYDITDDMSDWDYALYNIRKKRSERVNALIRKYGFPINERNLLQEDYAEYDLLKPELEAMKQQELARAPMPHGSSLDDEDMDRNATIVKAKKETRTQYGDATAKELDNYIKDYKLPKGKTRTGLLAPIYDFLRNYDDMESLKLETGDKFFHCKANYEASRRSAYGALVAGMMSVGREITDRLRKGDSWEDIWSDIKADERGITGGAQKKPLKDVCPTHYKKYK